MTAGGGPPSFKTQMNTQTALGGNRLAAFSPPFMSAYHFSPDFKNVLPPMERQRRLVQEGGKRVEELVPAAVDKQRLGGWHFAEAVCSQTLIIALNC